MRGANNTSTLPHSSQKTIVDSHQLNTSLKNATSPDMFKNRLHLNHLPNVPSYFTLSYLAYSTLHGLYYESYVWPILLPYKYIPDLTWYIVMYLTWSYMSYINVVSYLSYRTLDALFYISRLTYPISNATSCVSHLPNQYLTWSLFYTSNHPYHKLNVYPTPPPPLHAIYCCLNFTCHVACMPNLTCTSICSCLGLRSPTRPLISSLVITRSQSW